MKLSVRVPLVIAAIVLLTSASIIIAAGKIVTNEMTKTAYGAITNNDNAYSYLLKATLDAQLSQLWEIANRARTRTMDWEGVVKANLTPDVDRINSLDLGLVFPDGVTHYTRDAATTQLGDRDYIKQAFSGKNVVSDVLISRATNKLVVMLAVPVMKNDTKESPVIGVLISRKDGETFLASLIDKFKDKHSTGYGFLVNGEGTFSAHPNHELALKQFNPIKEQEKDPSLKSLADMIARVIKENSGIDSYVQDGKEMICAFTEVPGYPWKIILTAEKDEALAQVVKIRSLLLFIGVLCTLAGLFVAFLVGRSIARPVVRMAATLKDVGKGDLTKRVDTRSKDEIGDLSRHINSTLENIKSLIITIKKESEHLSGIGATLADNTTKTAAAVNQIADNIQSVRARAVSQSASVTQTNATMEQISVNIDKLNEHIEQQSTSVSESSSAVEEMLANIQAVTQTLIKNATNVKDLMTASEVGHAGLQDVAQDIQGISRESEGLLEINSVMESIASQTNLLSMNAAIEAAHAGEAGKGFAVVADEIRKLAESSSEQSKTISTVLKKIKESIDNITRSTDNVLSKFEAIDSGVKIVSNEEENIRNAMEEQGVGSKQILEAIGQLNEITQEVKSDSLQMLEGSKEIITEGKNLEKVTQEITGGMAEMAKGADQINVATHEVNSISGQNKEVIDNLAVAVSRFRV